MFYCLLLQLTISCRASSLLPASSVGYLLSIFWYTSWRLLLTISCLAFGLFPVSSVDFILSCFWFTPRLQLTILLTSTVDYLLSVLLVYSLLLQLTISSHVCGVGSPLFYRLLSQVTVKWLFFQSFG